MKLSTSPSASDTIFDIWSKHFFLAFVLYNLSLIQFYCILMMYICMLSFFNEISCTYICITPVTSRGEKSFCLIGLQTGALGSTYSTLKLPSTSNAPQIVFLSEIISDWQTLGPQNWKLGSKDKNLHQPFFKEEFSITHTHSLLHAKLIIHISLQWCHSVESVKDMVLVHFKDTLVIAMSSSWCSSSVWPFVPVVEVSLCQWGHLCCLINMEDGMESVMQNLTEFTHRWIQCHGNSLRNWCSNLYSSFLACFLFNSSFILYWCVTKDKKDTWTDRWLYDRCSYKLTDNRCSVKNNRHFDRYCRSTQWNTSGKMVSRSAWSAVRCCYLLQCPATPH